MKYIVHNSALPFQKGIEELMRQRGHQESEGTDNIVIKANWAHSPILKVQVTKHCILIEYNRKVHFFRGLTKALHWMSMEENKDKDFVLEEEINFQTIGPMLDCSRNGVLKVDTIKSYIRKIAELGMNIMQLYMEDTYEIKDYPYFGHLRGRYSYDELLSCDQYADLFGIEIIPCIQTLGHLHTPLRFPTFKEYKDTDDILLVGNEKVYELIDAMIQAVSAPFRSKKIHLGMDEAHDLGLGEFLRKHGFMERFKIMNGHLNKVMEICAKYDLKPMIWSDMYFRLLSPTGDYYNLSYDVHASDMVKAPDGIELVYWDYYHTEKELYENYFRLHKLIGKEISFAGGGWIWNGLAPNYSKMLATTEAALTVCKKEAISTISCTLWQDNGAETPLEAGEPALALFAEHCFNKDINWQSLKDYFAFVFGKNFDDCMLLDKFDALPGTLDNNYNADNPSKYYFYQDLMLGLFDGQTAQTQLTSYYKKLTEQLRAAEKRYTNTKLFHYYRILSDVLSQKADLGLHIKAAYCKQDRNRLSEIAKQVIPSCMEKVELLLVYRREIWFEECKPFGFEVLDIRINGVIGRLRSAQIRLEAYLNGNVISLPELEEKRIPFEADQNNPQHSLCSCPLWENIVSAGNISGV